MGAFAGILCGLGRCVSTKVGRKVTKRRIVTKSGEKIRGRFCESIRNPKSMFDPSSFRWTRAGGEGKVWILFGCPKGSWTGRRCRVGTKAHVILTPEPR